MMTRNEAEDRAERIWPGRVAAVRRARPSGERWDVDLAGDGRGHILDGNGHTDCHKECAAAEDRLP